MNPAGIKELYDRKSIAMTRRPAFARGSGQARIRLGRGFVCDVDHGDRTTRADIPESEGGTGTAPHPGQLMRASLGTCLAMGYRLWAARLDVPIDSVQVEITCEYDARGQMGLSPEVEIGWQRILVAVTIASSQTEDSVRRIVETANRYSPMLANLSPSIRRIHALTIVRSQTAQPDDQQPQNTAPNKSGDR